MQCKTKSKMDFFRHFAMIFIHIKLTNAKLKIIAEGYDMI